LFLLVRFFAKSSSNKREHTNEREKKQEEEKEAPSFFGLSPILSATTWDAGEGARARTKKKNLPLDKGRFFYIQHVRVPSSRRR